MTNREELRFTLVCVIFESGSEGVEEKDLIHGLHHGGLSTKEVTDELASLFASELIERGPSSTSWRVKEEAWGGEFDDEEGT